VFADPSISAGRDLDHGLDALLVSASHEALEVLADPAANEYSFRCWADVGAARCSRRCKRTRAEQQRGRRVERASPTTSRVERDSRRLSLAVRLQPIYVAIRSRDVADGLGDRRRIQSPNFRTTWRCRIDTPDPLAKAQILEGRIESDLGGAPIGANLREVSSNPDSLSAYVRSIIVGVDEAISTVALVDWTTVHHVHRLFAGDAELIDPFIALADLNALLAAALFYDRVVVLDADEIIDDVRDAIGLGSVLVTVSSDGGPLIDGHYSLLKWTLDYCFQKAAANLRNLRSDAPLLVDLRAAWQDMIPAAQLPRSWNVNDLSWSSSPGRPELLSQLFFPDAGVSWSVSPVTELIVDNDVRALTYENLAAVLTAASASAELSGPNVRYVGGALRAPMQRAMRAAWHRAWDKQRWDPSRGCA
jgi:hypothetical protein